MRITFLGTGTSMGVPVAGGFGSELTSNDPRNNRTRCAAWIEGENTSILIDVGPEFRIQSIRAQIKRVDHVLLTHEHMDHIGGLDDLRAYNYVQEGEIPVYGTDSCLESLKKRFDYLFGENKYPGSASIQLTNIKNTLQLGEFTVTPLPVTHGPLDILGYRIDDFVYLTDVKYIPDSTKDLMRGAKVVALSALRWGPTHPTHLTIPESVDIINELEIPTAYLIHMDSSVDQQEANKRLPSHIKLAYDQQFLTLD